MLARFLRQLVGPERRAKHTRGALAQAREAGRDGDFAATEPLWLAAIREEPHNAHAYLEYGLLCSERDEWKKALPPLETAVALAPGTIEPRLALARALLRAGKALRARQHCEAAVRMDPANPAAEELKNAINAQLAAGRSICPRRSAGEALRMMLTLPHVLASRAEIELVRADLANELERLAQTKIRISDAATEIGLTAFYLAYHGENDRAYQEQIAALHLAACPSLAYVAPRCRGEPRPGERLRIGLVSDYFHDHSIGRVTEGLLSQLDRDRFSVHVFGFRAPFDACSRAIAAGADESIVLPRRLDEARAAVADRALDVLLYPDVGMEPLTYFMTFARLAPVQCTTWGHPVTTGVPTMDWFLSTDYFEPEDGAGHYSERLFMLHDVAMPGYYRRPAEVPSASAASVGFDPARHTYLCPQSLFKLHPDFDSVLAAILRRDSLGEVVLVYDERADRFNRPKLDARLKRTAPDVADRVVFLPRAASREGYLQRLAAAHVILDTLHYCGGNTSLEAIAAGTPVVTLPSRFNRGRHTYGFFRKMRFTETIVDTPEDYVELAVRIACDGDFRAHLQREQAIREHALYEDDSAIDQIERFFEGVGRA